MLDLLVYEAEGVASGADALDRLTAASYAVVISDIVMSDVSGWMVAQHVRQRRPGIAVVLMTRQLTHAMAYRARHLGLSVLGKPFSLMALQAAIEEARRGRNQCPSWLRPDLEALEQATRACPPP